MNLPDLPKKYDRIESKIDGRVGKWLLDNHPRSCLYEVKMLKGRMAEHQQRLVNSVAKTGKFHYKFPDGGKRTPLDGVVLKDADAIVAWCDPKGYCTLEINKTYKQEIKV